MCIHAMRPDSWPTATMSLSSVHDLCCMCWLFDLVACSGTGTSDAAGMSLLYEFVMTVLSVNG